jgi:hypothetical protein
VPRLTEILSKHKTYRATAGGPGIDRRGLTKDLANLATNLRRVFWITAAMIAFVFIIQIAIAIVYLKVPTVLAGLAGTMGLTIVGAVDRMNRIGREMAQTHLLITLCDRLTTDQIATTVNIILEGQFKSK